MDYEESYERNIMVSFIKIIAYIFKWLFLIFAVVTTSLTVAFLVFAIFRNGTLDVNGLSKMAPLMTYYEESEIEGLISTLGRNHVIYGVIGYGFASSITYILLYMITSKFIKIFKFIEKKKEFKDESLKLINTAIPLGVLVTITQPVCLFITNLATGMFKYEDFNISGIIILLAIYVLKLMIENGNAILKEKEDYAKNLSKSSAMISEMKIDEIKRRSSKKEKQIKKNKKNTIKR